MDTVIPPQMPFNGHVIREPERNDVIRIKETDTTFIYYRLLGFYGGWNVEVSWVNVETGKHHKFPKLEVISGEMMNHLHAKALQTGNLFVDEV